jgi:Fic-DOC domain mobile mystery protein B
LRGQLNEAEQANILEAEAWAFARHRRDLISEAFIKRLHKRMFGQVWRWAGEYRTTEKNIGIIPWEIPVELRTLIDDAKVWIDKASFPPDELALRFKHRLVSIHCFANGNGRHSRMMGDLIAVRLGRLRFSWGSTNLTPRGDVRSAYIAALQAADLHDTGPLLAFARS